MITLSNTMKYAKKQNDILLAKKKCPIYSEISENTFMDAIKDAGIIFILYESSESMITTKISKHYSKFIYHIMWYIDFSTLYGLFFS